MKKHSIDYCIDNEGNLITVCKIFVLLIGFLICKLLLLMIAALMELRKLLSNFNNPLERIKL